MQLELSREEAALLHRELATHLQDMERELVRTDVAWMQHELARDLESLQRINARVQEGADQAAAGVWIRNQPHP